MGQSGRRGTGWREKQVVIYHVLSADKNVFQASPIPFI